MVMLSASARRRAITIDGETCMTPRTELDRSRQKLASSCGSGSFPRLTVLDNVGPALKVVKTVPREEAEAEAIRQLTLVDFESKAQQCRARHLRRIATALRHPRADNGGDAAPRSQDGLGGKASRVKPHG